MMRKILLILFAAIFTQVLFAQTLIFEYKEGKSYCNIEVDTTLAVNMGTFRAYEYLDVPYYEMTFKPHFEYADNGDQVLEIVPTWHYHAYLEKVYGEGESGYIGDSSFKLKFTIDPSGQFLTYRSTEAERKVIFNKSSFSKKGHIKMTDMPSEFKKTSKVDMDVFPRGLRKNLQSRMNKIKGRLQ